MATSKLEKAAIKARKRLENFPCLGEARRLEPVIALCEGEGLEAEIDADIFRARMGLDCSYQPQHPLSRGLRIIDAMKALIDAAYKVDQLEAKEKAGASK